MIQSRWLTRTCSQDVIQQVSGTVLCHCGACVSIKNRKVTPVSQLCSQLGHTGVGILHLSPPPLHACHSIVQPHRRSPLRHILFQNGMLQVRAGYSVIFIQVVLLPRPCLPGSSFEEEGDHLLCLFHQLSEEGGNLHVARPACCPHHSTESVLKLPARLGGTSSPPGAPPPPLCFSQQVQCNR